MSKKVLDWLFLLPILFVLWFSWSILKEFNPYSEPRCTSIYVYTKSRNLELFKRGGLKTLPPDDINPYSDKYDKKKVFRLQHGS